MHLPHIPEFSIQMRNVHISVLNGVLWDMRHVQFGVYEIGLLSSRDLFSQIELPN